MDLATRKSLLSQIPAAPAPPHSAATSFPIIAIALIGILATAFLLVSYHIFVIKCCLNWHRVDLLRRFSLSRNRTQNSPLRNYSPTVETRGLDESIIRSIPIFNFKRLNTDSSSECAVCLNEFQEDEKLRKIPNCSHFFHIDCIDIWLQNNDNCPLCRHRVSSNTPFLQLNLALAPSSSPADPIREDEDFVVIELGSHSFTDEARLMSSKKKKGGNLKKMNSMGDECIDIRRKDEQFTKIEPIRRSFSMDSSADRQLYLAIQEIVQQRREISPVEGCSSSSRTRRNYFFSFGHSKGSSRSSILPVNLETN